jgi:hypothetical protein
MMEWDEKGRRDDYLLPRGVQLERGRALLDDPGDVRIDDVRYYVNRSMNLESKRLSAEREVERMARHRLRLALFAVAGAAVIALFAFVVSFYEYQEASQQTVEAQRQLDRADAEATERKQQADETMRQLDRANQALAESINNDRKAAPFAPGI